MYVFTFKRRSGKNSKTLTFTGTWSQLEEVWPGVIVISKEVFEEELISV